jgi:adenylate cyclase
MVMLFTGLALPFLAAIIVLTFVTTNRAITTTSEDIVDRFNNQVVREVQLTLDPAISFTRSAATLAERDPGFFRNENAWYQLQSHLLQSPDFLSAYIGFDDRSIRAVYRASEGDGFFKAKAPKEAKFAYIDFNREPSQTAYTQVFFKNETDQVVERANVETSYDPKIRPWYQAAVAQKRSIVYGPILDAATGHIELTFATPVIVNDRVTSVTAIDMSLDTLQYFLNSNLISKNAITLILDSNMKVVVSSGSNNQSSDKLHVFDQINDMTSDLPKRALLSLPSSQFLGAFNFKSDTGNTTYMASINQVNLKVPVDWRVLSIAPASDFLTEVSDNNRFIAVIGVIALIAQLLVIYFMSVRIARPLEQLALQVDGIEQLKVSEVMPLPHSFFYEIDRLTKSVEKMRKAIAAFALFVPVDLVRGLLKSEQKLELGGHSRFLTIMFCDLEGFSTLSENSPSQSLLLRVSKYLEVATRSINEEMGTVDKFIGDGVMAFWGAPNTLEDHAFRACAAALKIQERMDEINQEWERQGLPPLKVRIGIHSDVVLVGNIGSLERMSYTVMGDGVNVAARLEGVNKELGTRICLSKAVVREAGERLKLRKLDDVTVKGRKSIVEVYELLGLEPTEQHL